MAEQGSMIVNGEKVEGRTLSFDNEGVKVGNGTEEKVVVPNSFEFAEEAEVTESDFEDYEGPTEPMNDFKNYHLDKKYMIGAGVAVGVIAGLIIGGVIYKKKKG